MTNNDLKKAAKSVTMARDIYMLEHGDDFDADWAAGLFDRAIIAIENADKCLFGMEVEE